jgi:hypothetical protein
VFDLSRDEVKDALRPIVIELVAELLNEKLASLSRLFSGSFDNGVL